MTVWHMRDLVSGKRCLIKAKDVKHANVPFFEGLSIEEMINFALPRKEKVMEAFPSEARELRKLPR